MSYDFIYKPKDFNIKMHQTLARFHENHSKVYNNVPIDKTLEMLQTDILNNSSLLPEAMKELINLVKEILNANYFFFDGTYCIQSCGLVMGSSLLGILSEVYINYIKYVNILSENEKLLNKTTLYNRYPTNLICY